MYVRDFEKSSRVFHKTVEFLTSRKNICLRLRLFSTSKSISNAFFITRAIEIRRKRKERLPSSSESRISQNRTKKSENPTSPLYKDSHENLFTVNMSSGVNKI